MHDDDDVVVADVACDPASDAVSFGGSARNVLAGKGSPALVSAS